MNLLTGDWGADRLMELDAGVTDYGVILAVHGSNSRFDEVILYSILFPVMGWGQQKP